MIEKQYQCQDLGTREYEYLKELLDSLSPYEALEMKQVIDPSMDALWTGVLDNHKILAVALNMTPHIYLTGNNVAAAVALGESMSRTIGKRPTGHIYSLYGPDDIVMAFMQGYKMCNCKQLGDIKLNVCELTKLAYKLNDAYAKIGG